MDSLLTYAGLGAAGGVIWGAWNYIKGLAQIFGALFIGNMRIVDTDLRHIVWKTLGDKGMRLPQATEVWDMLAAYHKITGKRVPILYTITTADRSAKDNSYIVFWYKRVPVILNCSPDKGNQGVDTLSIWNLYYPRGLFDIAAFLDEVVAVGTDWTNTHRRSTAHLESTQAYRVIDMVGSLDRGGDRPIASDDANSPRGSYSAVRDYELLVKGINRKHGPIPITEYSIVRKYTKQYLDYLVYPDNIYEAIEQATNWKESKEWYTERGIPWTLGWLLHGKPGTGKSALVKATAEKLDLPVYVFHLATMSNRDFVNDWRTVCADTPAMVVFEDFDGVFTGRTNNSKDTMHNVLSFDTVLNTLDGVAKNDGIFLVITTNHIDKVDEALGTIKDGKPITRPGRIDYILELTNMTEACRRKIADRILCDFPAEEREALVAAAIETTAAQFTNMCINHVRQNNLKGE